MSVKLSKVLERFVTRIEAETDATALDVVGPQQERPDHLQHQGFALYVPDTETIARHHGDADIRVRDQVVVDLGYRIVPANQRASYRAAVDLEEDVIVALTAKSWMKDASWNVTTRDDIEVHVDGVRRVSVGGGEWLRILITLGVARSQDIG